MKIKAENIKVENKKWKKKKGQSYSLKNIKQLEKPLPNIITKRSRKHKYTKFLKNDIEGLNIIRYWGLDEMNTS